MRLRSAWGQATAWLDRSRRTWWIDLAVLLGLMGLFFGLFHLGHQWTGEYRQATEIDLDNPWVLPKFTFFSLCRGLIAYVISLLFTLVYGYWAAKDRTAQHVLIPVLDILQSIPVLSFMPAVFLALVAAFPAQNLGLELASVIMIFTGQAWNMTFSYYHSLRSIPSDLREVATIYRLSWWQRLKWLELPYAAVGLVWNSMMSMAGGWFFLTLCESFELKGENFRLPGIGSYMKEAVEKGRVDAMCYAILAMIIMILALDQLLWRPVVVWAQKFRFEEGGQQQAMTSWFLNWLRQSRVLNWLGELIGKLRLNLSRASPPPSYDKPAPEIPAEPAWARALSTTCFVALLVGMAYGAWLLLLLLRDVSLAEWGQTLFAASLTLGRVLAATALGTLWAVPAGLAIGLSPRLSRILQPVVQVLASFPAPMLFPMAIAVLTWAGITLNWGSLVLMLLGTQWYILFNVVAGAMAVPADLREAARSFRIVGWQRFWQLHVPAIFPYLVTGWVTAAGGAWNASIVSEAVSFRGEDLIANGLGARIYAAASDGNYGLLAASTLVMSSVVVLFNRLVWRRLYHLAEGRYSLSK